VREVRKGDPIQAGFVISNSEVGMGSVSAFPYLVRLACLNGAVYQDFGKRKYHIGRAGGNGEEDAYELFTDETLKADDEAFWLKMRDIVLACIEESRFEVIIDRMRQIDGVRLEDPVHAVAEISNKYALTEAEQNGVLRQLIEGGIGMTGYGLSNAVTALAGELEDYDRATELETIGANIITLEPKDWKEIAHA